MEVQAPRTAAHSPSPSGGHAIPGLRAELAHDFAAAYGRDPQYHQLDRLELVAGWLLRARQDRPGVVFRSVPQIVAVLGLPYDGTVRDARQRWRRALANTLGYLADMGWVRSVSPRYAPNGEGEGWEIRLGDALSRCKVLVGRRSSAGRAADF